MSKTIIVLGMHRSATSLIARSLHGEIYMGSDQFFLPPASDNEKGFYEDSRIVRLNDVILQKASGNWFTPPSAAELKSVVHTKEITIVTPDREERVVTLDDAIRMTLDTLYDEASDKTLGIKDPRMCLLMDLYLPHLKNPQYIMSWRNPEDIVRSLIGRHQHDLPRISYSGWMKLVHTYNSRAQKFINEQIKYR